MTLQDLVMIYRNRLNLSLEELGDAVGVSKSTVSRWESGVIKKISIEKQQRLGVVLGIDVNDYLNHHFVKPILGKVRAGYDFLVNEAIVDYAEVSKRDYDRGDYFLRVDGDSMTGSRIYDGDLIYVKQQSDVESGEIAVILLDDDEVTVKRIIKKEGLLILEASNPAYPTRYYTEKDLQDQRVTIIAKVLHVHLAF